MKPATQQFLPTELLEALGHGVCLLGRHEDVVGWNPQLEKLGIPSAEALGRPLAKVIGPCLRQKEDLDRLLDALGRTRATRDPVLLHEIELNFPTAPGQVMHVCAAPAGEHESRALLIFENVTEPLRSREQFERILDSTPDGIFVIDHTRRIRFFNRSCAYITGRDAADVLRTGSLCSEIIQCHNEEGESMAHALCPAKSVFSGDNLHQCEEMLLTNADGEERWVETTYSPVFTSAGRVDFVVGILRDVHERKILEERLHQTEKLASLGQLVAGIAHEIKNPLAIILSSLDVMQNSQRPAEQREEAGAFIREEIQRLDERLRAFLAFARPRELRMESLVLSGLVRKRLAGFAPLFPGIRFQVDAQPPEPIILGDEEQLGQVITNLVMNAADAMNYRGSITVRLRQHGDMIHVEIEDDGPGIPPDHLVRVFDPFFTTKANGTGLGLSICYQIVLGHRGTISVSHGRSGRGTCFTIRLPMATRFEDQPPPQAVPAMERR